jgi:hypothetical protein
MTSRLTCPNGHTLAITPKVEGKSVRCSKCKAIVRVPISSNRDASKKGNKAAKAAKAEKQLRVQQLAAAHLGLSFYRWKFILSLAAQAAYLVALILVPVIVGLVVTAHEERSDTLLEIADVAIRVLAYCAGFGLLTTFVLAPLLGIIGGSYLVRVPTESGARGLSIAALALDAVPLACGVLWVCLGAFTVNPRGREIPITPIVLSLVAGLAIMVSFVLFMLCMSKCAAYRMDSDTAGHAIAFMIYYLLATIAGPIVIGISFATLSDELISRGVILFAMALCWMIIMIRQLIPNLYVIETVRGRL